MADRKYTMTYGEAVRKKGKMINIKPIIGVASPYYAYLAPAIDDLLNKIALAEARKAAEVIFWAAQSRFDNRIINEEEFEIEKQEYKKAIEVFDLFAKLQAYPPDEQVTEDMLLLITDVFSGLDNRAGAVTTGKSLLDISWSTTSYPNSYNVELVPDNKSKKTWWRDNDSDAFLYYPDDYIGIGLDSGSIYSSYRIDTKGSVNDLNGIGEIYFHGVKLSDAIYDPRTDAFYADNFEFIYDNVNLYVRNMAPNANNAVLTINSPNLANRKNENIIYDSLGIRLVKNEDTGFSKMTEISPAVDNPKISDNEKKWNDIEAEYQRIYADLFSEIISSKTALSPYIKQKKSTCHILEDESTRKLPANLRWIEEYTLRATPLLPSSVLSDTHHNSAHNRRGVTPHANISIHVNGSPAPLEAKDIVINEMEALSIWSQISRNMGGAFR